MYLKSDNITIEVNVYDDGECQDDPNSTLIPYLYLAL